MITRYFPHLPIVYTLLYMVLPARRFASADDVMDSGVWRFWNLCASGVRK